MNPTDQSASASAGVACRLPRVVSDRGEPATGDEPMLAARNDLALRIFSTCPPSARAARDEYLRQVQEIASWSEDAGCEGILVYTDNAQVDPWFVAAEIIRATRTLCPLVAIQPAYMHPYSVAKMVTSLAFLHGRRVFLNMVAGGFTNDLAALNDHTPHDERYDRVVEYTLIVQRLLRGEGPVSFQGAYYRVTNLRMIPPLPAELMPGICISGSSPAGLAAARALGATAVKYPQPVDEEHANEYGDVGIRVGSLPGRAQRRHGASLAAGSRRTAAARSRTRWP